MSRSYSSSLTAKMASKTFVDVISNVNFGAAGTDQDRDVDRSANQA